MRITFILTQSLESPSGLGRYWPLAKELAGLGHKVTILTLHHDFAALETPCFTRDGVDVRYVGQMHVRKVGSSKLYFSSSRLIALAAQATWRLLTCALKTPTDVYHLGKPHPMNGIAGVLAGRLRGKPIYLDCDDYEAASNHYGKTWQKWGVDFCERGLPAFARAITTNTHETARRLAARGYPARRIIYAPNGVDRQRFERVDPAKVASLRQQLELNDRKVVLFAGTLSLANHAVDLLIESFRLLRQMEPRAVLLMVGGGQDLDRLKAETDSLGLADSARFTGRVAPDEMPAYYLLADVSVDPVRDDPVDRSRCPLKVVESLVAGIPVVTGDVGDRALLLANGGGLLTRAGDARALADTMLEVLTDDGVASRLRAEAREAGKGFYWDGLVYTFAQVYAC